MARCRRQIGRLHRIAADELNDVEALGEPQQVAIVLEVAGAAAMKDPNVQKFMEGKPVRKAIYVPGKLVNIVV